MSYDIGYSFFLEYCSANVLLQIYNSWQIIEPIIALQMHLPRILFGSRQPTTSQSQNLSPLGTMSDAFLVHFWTVLSRVLSEMLYL